MSIVRATTKRSYHLAMGDSWSSRTFSYGLNQSIPFATSSQNISGLAIDFRYVSSYDCLHEPVWMPLLCGAIKQRSLQGNLTFRILFRAGRNLCILGTLENIIVFPCKFRALEISKYTDQYTVIIPVCY